MHSGLIKEIGVRRQEIGEYRKRHKGNEALRHKLVQNTGREEEQRYKEFLVSSFWLQVNTEKGTKATRHIGTK